MNEKIIENFLSLCAIPHKSHHEEKISRFLYDWAVKKGLAAVRDEEGNVIIDKAGSAGHEDAPRTILQAHMDMVVVWEDGIKVVGNTLYYYQAVHQESDVIPENIDCIRSMCKVEQDAAASRAKTDAALGISKTL